MATRFVDIDRDTPMLLPPDLRDWVPADHLVHFVLDAIEQVDLHQFKVDTRGTADAQPPSMLLALLVYSYAIGVFGSRRIEQSTYDNIAMRLLTADTHRDGRRRARDSGLSRNAPKKRAGGAGPI
jgi:transposase